MELEKSLVYGPVWSRRFGWDLGINLLPLEHKLCSFDCVYCQYGFTSPFRNDRFHFPEAEMVIAEWAHQLEKCSRLKIDIRHTTFSGNGEPTMNPNFPKIVPELISWRNQNAPDVKLAILSNGYRLRDPAIRNAMQYFDETIVKLDSAIPSKLQQINQPLTSLDLGRFLNELRAFPNLIIQTIFIKGWNDSAEDLKQWREALLSLRPHSVQIYTISRDTPLTGLHPLSEQELIQIAEETTRTLHLPVTAFT